MHYIQQKVTYSIAGLLLEFVVPDGFNRKDILPSFEPFLVEHALSQTKICSIELAFSPPSMKYDGGKLRSNVSVIYGEHFQFYEHEDCYITTISSVQDSSLIKMKSNKDFSQSSIYLLNEDQLKFSGLSWLIMVAFGQTCLLHRTILIHASVVAYSGKGYAFLGKSGTGKSTHSRLWLEHLQETQLLNDDNPAIRMENDGHVYVYGTPWSGKTSCYKSIKFRLQAFVRLKQAAKNKLSWKTGIDAFICILPSCTAIRWNKHLFNKMSDTVEAIIQKTLVTELECLPNREAALLCCREISALNNQHTEKFISGLE